jgi:hypothetical protein
MNKVTDAILAIFIPLAVTARAEKALPEPPPKKVKAVKLGNISDLAERSLPRRALAAQQSNLSFCLSGWVSPRESSWARWR